MESKLIIDNIEEKLNFLACRIKTRNKNNLQDLNIFAEKFYMTFMNLLCNLNLINANAEKTNMAGFDLIDVNAKIIIQVTSTDTKQKIEDTLKKEICQNYKDYTLKFIFIASADCKNLEKLKFKNPYGLKIEILDLSFLIGLALQLELNKLKEIQTFVNSELNINFNVEKMDTNLATLVNILAKEDLTCIDDNKPKVFEIENKISYNNLQIAKTIITEYNSFGVRLTKIYKEYDFQGTLKTQSILQKIRNFYLQIQNNEYMTSDDKFFNIIKEVTSFVVNSKNYVLIHLEELELCINIIVVDAFIRCKIFENPRRV